MDLELLPQEIEGLFDYHVPTPQILQGVRWFCLSVCIIWWFNLMP